MHKLSSICLLHLEALTYDLGITNLSGFGSNLLGRRGVAALLAGFKSGVNMHDRLAAVSLV